MPWYSWLALIIFIGSIIGGAIFDWIWLGIGILVAIFLIAFHWLDKKGGLF